MSKPVFQCGGCGFVCHTPREAPRPNPRYRNVHIHYNCMGRAGYEHRHTDGSCTTVGVKVDAQRLGDMMVATACDLYSGDLSLSEEQKLAVFELLRRLYKK
jgi:hypothetical protein